MLTVKFAADAGRGWVNSIRSSLSTASPLILEECGRKLVGLAKIYFDNLSQGRAGFSGRRWPKSRPSTMRRRRALAAKGQLRAAPYQQGILTGAMQKSLAYHTGSDSVRVSYDAPHAYWFNIHRRIIPTVLPTVWRNALDLVVVTHFYNQIKDGKD